ncbi:hypothetical protein BH20ACT4_BH20ACT4_06760 [soil metagenome]
MRRNAADHSFVLIVLAAAAPFGVLLVAGCGLAAYLARRISAGEIDGLTSGLLIPTLATLAQLGQRRHGRGDG